VIIVKNLKRIHLFELEDQSWFPQWIRDCMTKALNVMHTLVKTNEHLPDLLAKVLKETKTNNIVDLCSGGGGPMLEAMDILKNKHGLQNLQLKMTDLYPHQELVNELNANKDDGITYSPHSIDATNVPATEKGLRTMICSFHHMPPTVAQGILRNAQFSQQPMLIYEISDNSQPIALTILSMPITFIVCLVISLKVRPMTWQQIVFTYLIPIIPLCFAWDGAISNVRTYTIDDMNELLHGLETDSYEWTPGEIKGKPSSKLYLIGKPSSRE